MNTEIISNTNSLPFYLSIPFILFLIKKVKFSHNNAEMHYYGPYRRHPSNTFGRTLNSFCSYCFVHKMLPIFLFPGCEDYFKNVINIETIGSTINVCTISPTYLWVPQLRIRRTVDGQYYGKEVTLLLTCTM